MSKCGFNDKAMRAIISAICDIWQSYVRSVTFTVMHVFFDHLNVVYQLISQQCWHSVPKQGIVNTQIAKFIGPTWSPSGVDRTQVGPMLTSWTLLSGYIYISVMGLDWTYVESAWITFYPFRSSNFTHEITISNIARNPTVYMVNWLINYSMTVDPLAHTWQPLISTNCQGYW